MAYRRIGAFVTAAALLATAACGGGDDGDTSAGGSNAGDEAGVAKVGAILSLSGIYSTLGPPEKQAMTMGLETLNEDGFEVDGKPYTLEIVFADDKSDAATTGVAAFREMTQAQELPLIGFGLGSSTYAPLLKREPIAMVNILDSTYPSILDYDEHLFLTRGASPTYVPGCLAYAKEKLGASSISVITASGEPYAEGLTELVQLAADEQGVDVAAVAEYPLGATDYGNAISQAVASSPDAIYLSSVTAVILPVLKQLRQSGYTGPVLHSSGVNPDQAEAILGASFNDIMKDNYDCAGTLPTTSDNADTQAFAKAYQDRWDEYPQDLTMWAHDFPFVVAAAMEKAASTTDPEAIYKALSEIEVPEGAISGWLQGDGGTFFEDRQSRTASEVTAWCPEQKTIASAMVFDADEGKVVDPKFVDEPCAAVG